jgi:hypothetical protein
MPSSSITVCLTSSVIQSIMSSYSSEYARVRVAGSYSATSRSITTRCFHRQPSFVNTINARKDLHSLLNDFRVNIIT